MHVNRTIGPILTYRFHEKEKKIIWLLTGIAAVSLLVLCTVVIVRTATYPFIRTTGPDGLPERRTVRPGRRTIGRRNPDSDRKRCDRPDGRQSVQAFKAYLPQAYPAIYSQLDTLTINEYGLVFRWPGKNPALPPILLCSHYDVVPVLNYDPSAPDAPLPGWDYPLRRRSRRTDLRARHARHERHAVLDPRSDRLAACGGIRPGAGRVDRPRIRRGDRRHAGRPEDRPLFRRTGHCFRRRL